MNLLKINQNGQLEEIKDSKIKNLNDIPLLYYWENDKIKLLGYNIEKINNENKYDLPPPIDEILYFGDLFLVKIDKNNNYIDLTVKDFEKFYNNKFEGFYDINYTEDEEEDELSMHSSDLDFIDDNDVINDNDTDNDDIEEILDDKKEIIDDDSDDYISFSISDNDNDDNDSNFINNLDDNQDDNKDDNQDDNQNDKDIDNIVFDIN